MTITAAVNKSLDSMFPYQEFTGLELQKMVNHYTGENPFVATCLRLMQMWRAEFCEYNPLTVICLNRRKSLYRVVEKL